MPTVSVIIPVYNAQLHLAQCLDSVLVQSYRDWELLCVDDGSTDGSAAILRQYAALEPRLTVVTQANSGVSAARNRGLELARGEYLLFLDADDFIEPELLQCMVAAAHRTDCDMVLCSSTVIFENASPATARQDRILQRSLTLLPGRWDWGGTPESSWAAARLPGVWPFVWNKLLRRQLLQRRHVGFPEGLPLGEDGLFLLQLLPELRHAVFLQESLHHYRYRSTEGATCRLTADPQQRFLHHVQVASRLCGFYREQGLWEAHASFLQSWLLWFLYSDFVDLPAGDRTRACHALAQLPLVPALGRTALERRRLASLMEPAATRCKAKRLQELLTTKLENRLSRLLDR